MDLPAHQFLDQRGIPYLKLSFSPETPKGAASVAEALGYQPGQMVKTLIFQTGAGERVLVMLGGDKNAVSGHLKRAIGNRNIRLADAESVYPGDRLPDRLNSSLPLAADGLPQLHGRGVAARRGLGCGSGSLGGGDYHLPRVAGAGQRRRGRQPVKEVTPGVLFFLRIQRSTPDTATWIPAFAGMTEGRRNPRLTQSRQRYGGYFMDSGPCRNDGENASHPLLTRLYSTLAVFPAKAGIHDRLASRYPMPVRFLPLWPSPQLGRLQSPPI